jgi:fido (protein-threonine AMPylation protein)
MLAHCERRVQVLGCRRAGRCQGSAQGLHARGSPILCRVSTEGELRDWRWGPIMAERLAAAILSLDGFANIDPQATLGGADAKKDILASREGKRWIAAVHFPPTGQTFASIKRKFKGDYTGVARHEADAFAFFVNQHLTVGQRDKLKDLTAVPTELYHLERIRNILDTPGGYGVRLEYLRIAMTLEEQIAFLDQQHRALGDQMATLLELPGAVAPEAVEQTLNTIEQTLSALVPHAAMSSIAVPATVLSERIANSITSLAELNVGDLRLMHRELTDSEPWANGGQLRAVNAWIGSGDHTSYVPPAPEQVRGELEEELERWREDYPRLVGADEPQVIKGLARLHAGICAVHPFLDANGRLARAVLDVGAQRLLNRRVGPGLTSNPSEYYESLRAANEGDIGPLVRVVEAALADG